MSSDVPRIKTHMGRGGIVLHGWETLWSILKVGTEGVRVATGNVKREDFRFARMKRAPAIRGLSDELSPRSTHADFPVVCTCSNGPIRHKRGVVSSNEG